MRSLLTLFLVVLVVPVSAQQQEIRSANLPRELERELLRMYERAEHRFDGPAVIGATEVVDGDVAAVGGPLRIAGEVRGDVAVVGGDLELEPGGHVTGRVTVIGGEVRMADGAGVGGTITSYGRSERGWTRDRESRRWYGGDGDSRLFLRTGASYNRVEGLPILFGPVIRTAGSNPLELEAFLIWRTEENPLDSDRVGYRVGAEQFLGGHRRFSAGAGAFSVVQTLDGWQIRDLEASLAAALFHRDYRDHYDRTGWNAFLRAHPSDGVDARLEFRDEEHGALAAADPWSLFDRSAGWRLQPLVAVGDVRTVAGALELDLREDDRPWDGWRAWVTVERPVGGSLVRPELTTVAPYPGSPVADPNPDAAIPAMDYDLDFTTGFVDLRRYAPVGWRSDLRMRVVVGGSLTEAPLPPQYQHALGGPGTLPGFAAFHADCGARASAGSHREQRFFPAYGCDRFAVAQVEYRGGLSLDLGFGDDRRDRAADRRAADRWDREWWERDWDVDLDPSWVVFLDAGRGWAYADPTLGLDDRSTGTLYDVGLGLLFGDLGIYAAMPLNEEVEQEPRFLVRLGRRF